MRPLYYRNLNPSHFFSNTDFNLSSEHLFESRIIDNQLNDDLSVKYIEVELSYKISDQINLFKDSSYISDVKVIVGKNGVGKSTLINDVFKIISTTNLALSCEIIIGEDFIIIGDKIKLSINEQTKKRMLNSFPEIKLWLAHASVQNAHMFGANKIIGSGEGSFIQQRKKGIILYYSDTLEIQNLNSYKGKIYTSEEAREEGQNLIDLTTLNRLVISNKWGLKSTLKNSIYVNNLIAYQDYETIHFLDEYFDNGIIKELIDVHIFERIEINFQLGSLIDSFVNYVNENLDTIDFMKKYSVFQYITGRFNGDSLLYVYRELLLTVALLELDDLVNKGATIANSLENVISDFTENITHLDKIFDHRKIITNDKFKEITVAYINSRDKHVQYNEIYKVIDEVICPYFESKSKIKNQLEINGLEGVGITLNLKEDEELVKGIKDCLQQLKKVNLEIPFFQMKIAKLSAGETSYISMITRMLSAFNFTNHDGLCSVYLVLDEPGNSYHPDWQKRLFNNINKFLERYNSSHKKVNVNMLITTHSPFILSDFSNGHILKLNRVRNKTIIKLVERSSFGANIHDLLANDFFLLDGFMGEFAKTYINDLVLEIQNVEGVQLDETIYDSFISKVNIIGEPVLKNAIKSILDQRFEETLVLRKREAEIQKELKNIQNRLQ